MGRRKSSRTEIEIARESANYDSLGDGWNLIISMARWYPDFLCDLYLDDNADFSLTMIQRVIMRAKARNKYCSITGCRGLTKTYCTFLEEMVEMLVYPGIQISYYGPSFRQTAQICSKVYHSSIERNYPGLAAHFDIVMDTKDTFEIKTYYGSGLSISAFRGNTVHKTVIEEAAQEEPPQFDWEEYRRVVIPTIRAKYNVQGRPDPYYIPYKQQMITSAGRRQNDAYLNRCLFQSKMKKGESAYALDIPFDVVLLSQIRDVQWAMTSEELLTPEEWRWEMQSLYSGGDKDPLIPDQTLFESRRLMVMEEHHCCKDFNNTLKPEDVFYIVGYDVSYADGAANAKCACAVIKCTKQKEFLKRDRYLKQLVWLDDWDPKPPMEQAQRLKKIWYRYCYEGHHAYIAIDAWQYGSAVLQALMMDLGDGLGPLSTYKHSLYTEYELEGAIPIIYPIKAGGAGTKDPDSEMVRNAQLQFDNRNVELLTPDFEEGIAQYKRIHRIKDDKNDWAIWLPYKKTNELIIQIQNLQAVQNAAGTSEKRITNRQNRDSWSATKYAIRFAQVLEREVLVKKHTKSDWDEELKKFEARQNEYLPGEGTAKTRIPFKRKGGRIG